MTEEIPRTIFRVLGEEPDPEKCPECPPLKRRMLRAAMKRPEIHAWIR